MAPHRRGEESVTRLLVTGCSGFLGRALLDALRPTMRYRITAVTRRHGDSLSGVEVLELDLARLALASDSLGDWRWDAVVHLAGDIQDDSRDFGAGARLVESHVRMALNMIAAMPPTFSGPVVYSSSMTVCGTPTHLPIEENAIRRPTTFYALGKALAEDVILTRCENAWVMRLPGLFGEWRDNGAIAAFARAAVRGADICVTATEPTPWDILHVRDAADAIVLALESSNRGPGVINISYGEPVELAAVAKAIAALGAKGSRVTCIKGVTHPVVQFNVACASRLLGWSPPRLETRLRELVAAHRERAQ